MVKPIDLGAFEGPDKLEAVTRIAQSLQRRLHESNMRTDRVVDAVIQSAYEAGELVRPPKSFIPSVDLRKGKPEVALWHLTDWQGAKLTVSYDSKVMQKRVDRKSVV